MPKKTSQSLFPKDSSSTSDTSQNRGSPAPAVQWVAPHVAEGAGAHTGPSSSSSEPEPEESESLDSSESSEESSESSSWPAAARALVEAQRRAWPASGAPRPYPRAHSAGAARDAARMAQAPRRNLLPGARATHHGRTHEEIKTQ